MNSNLFQTFIFALMLFASTPLICYSQEIGNPSDQSNISAFGPESTDSESEPTWHFSLEQARQIGESIGIDRSTAAFSVKQFRVGLEVELEHGSRDPQTDVTHDDPLLTAKIALAHLKELSDYYYRLSIMEGEDAYFQELLGTSKP